MKVYNASTISNCIKKASQLAVLNSKSFSNVLIFAEDKITLSLELEICSLSGGGFMNIDVCTFKRYISSKNGGLSCLSKESSVMAVRKLILENQSIFSCFKNSLLKPNLPILLYELISQLKSAKISPLDLNKVIENDSLNLSSSLLYKIKDILLIYSKYEDYLTQNSLIDNNDYLLTIKDVIDRDSSLKDTYVLLVGFSSLTKQRQDVFKQLKGVSKKIDAVLLNDDNSEFYTGETINKLLNLFDDIEIEKDQTPLNEEATLLKKYLFNPAVFSKDFKKFDSKNISIYEAYSPKEEIENVAKDILIELKYNNKRYKDISLTVGDFDGYLPVIKKTFAEYNIPFYADKNRALIDHPLCEYILSYLQLVKRGFCREDFIAFTTNPLFCADKNLTDDLTEYLLTYSLSRKSLSKPFTYSDPQLNKFEQLRQTAYEVFELFKNKKTVDEYVENVKAMLIKTNALNNLKTLKDKLTKLSFTEYAVFSDSAYEKLDEILNEVEILLKGVSLSVLDFSHILVSGMTATTVGAIPLFNDAVYVGSCKDVKIKNADILYAVGLNGEVPFSKSDTSILTDSDLYELDSFKVIVEPKLKIINLRERENVCLSLISFNQKLKLSYSNVSPNGKEVLKSELINYITNLFKIKPLRYISNNILNDFTDVSKIAIKYSSPLSSLKEVAINKGLYDDNDERVRFEISSLYTALERENLVDLKTKVDDILTSFEKEKSYIDEKYVKNFNDFNISASVLEKYFACPYSNYAKNVLKLKEKQTGEMQAFETGNFLHLILQNYIKNIEKVSDIQSSNGLVEELFNNALILDEFKKLTDNPKFSYLKISLLNEAKRVCFEIFTQLKKSDFKPYLLEQNFGDKHPFKSIVLKSKHGDFKLNGKVDRIDKYENNIRIIDYKSGNLSSSEESFYTGNKLQLYLYMNAFKVDGLTPAGVYYFPVNDEFNEKPESYPYKMHGKTVNDNNILIATDNKIFENRESKIIGTKITKNDKPFASAPLLTKNELDCYLKYSIEVSKQGLNEFTSGYIKPTPYEKACEYCSYNAMCGFFINDKKSNERKELGVKSSTIINAVKNTREDDKNE